MSKKQFSLKNTKTYIKEQITRLSTLKLEMKIKKGTRSKSSAFPTDFFKYLIKQLS